MAQQHTNITYKISFSLYDQLLFLCFWISSGKKQGLEYPQGRIMFLHSVKIQVQPHLRKYCITFCDGLFSQVFSMQQKPEKTNQNIDILEKWVSETR